MLCVPCNMPSLKNLDALTKQNSTTSTERAWKDVRIQPVRKKKVGQRKTTITLRNQFNNDVYFSTRLQVNLKNKNVIQYVLFNKIVIYVRSAVKWNEYTHESNATREWILEFNETLVLKSTCTFLKLDTLLRLNKKKYSTN